MAQFEAINKDVEVNKQTVMSVVEAMDHGKNERLNILLKNGINLDKEEWFNQQKWLDAFKDIAISLGDMNLFMIGKAIIDNAKFPPIKDLEEGLRVIDVAYHMNHRLDGEVMFDGATGKMIEGIGHYSLTEFNPIDKIAFMVCDNPYPSKFDEGIITQIVRKFKPSGARDKVSLDLSKECRLKGGNSCTYKIIW
ncbi:hypothetical protein ACFLS4_01250 [Bacteroidota bacterium]